MRQVNLERTFNPMIKATEKSTKAITSALIPLRDEIKTVSKSLPVTVSRKRLWDEDSQLTAIDYYLNKYTKKDLDKYYGIQRDDDDDNKLMMGDKEVTVDDNSDIIVDNERYNATPGLWSLIMLATPNEKSYTEEDFKASRIV